MIRNFFISLTTIFLGSLALIQISLAAAPSANISADSCLYLPPCFSNRVVFYDGFERRNIPEINRIHADIAGTCAVISNGFAGNGCRSTDPRQHEQPLMIRSPALSPNRPLTVMRNWRVDVAQRDVSSFQLIALLGKGHISCFVHGKGEWCALKVPSLFVQIDSFPQIANVNEQVRDNTYFKPGEWHNVTLTIANASDVRFYLDGQPLVAIEAKGRQFNSTDIDTLQGASDSGAEPENPTSTDDLIVVDRVLSPAEIEQYWQAAVNLRQMGYPPIVPAR